MKKALDFAKKNWYAIVVTVGMFLMAIEVLDTWAGFGVPFLCGLGYLVKIKLID